MELYRCLGDFECYTVNEDGYSTRDCYLIKIDSLWEYKGTLNYPGAVRLDRVVDNGKVLSINEPDSILIREFVFSAHFTKLNISETIESEKKYQLCDKYYSDLINHIILFAKSKFSYFREQADICHKTANDAYTIQLRDDYITRANCYGEMIRLIEKAKSLFLFFIAFIISHVHNATIKILRGTITECIFWKSPNATPLFST